MAEKTKLSFETGMLAYARSVQVSEGLFFATRSDNPEVVVPIEILEKGVRGQTSNDLKPGKYKDAGNSNPQSVEYAVMPIGYDIAKLCFSIRFMPFSKVPYACNDASVVESYKTLAEHYTRAGGYHTLVERYVWNIANARFAWRNRFQSDEMTVLVEFDGKKLSFNPFLLDLDVPASRADLVAALVEGDEQTIDDLVEEIADGLTNDDDKACTIKVTWSATMEPGQEIFPSQEYVRAARADKYLSRVLAKLPTFFAGRELQQASMHSQKIGAALRHIDTWYGDGDLRVDAIAVNPYGGVQETGDVLRAPKSKKSFYELRAKPADLLAGLKDASREEISPDVHFVMANLLRGGVFGKAKEA